MTERVVQVEHLSRQFGKTTALNDVSLTLEPGLVYGLVGANGAGKTTLIKHLMGLLRAKHGSVKVFGVDPVREPVNVLSRIGYLSEQRDLPEWMQIDEMLEYLSAFYPAWDRAYVAELLETFALDASKKVKQLSKGMRAQAGLIAAVAHHPELLLLDEPSTGLDAVVRKDILNAVIRAVADNGRTVLFSSHLLDEVELMSDHVFMINQGKLVLEGSLEDIREQHQVLSVRFDSCNQSLPKIDGILAAERHGKQWHVVCNGNQAHVRQTLADVGGQVEHLRTASLQEIFVARVGRARQSEEG
ncbi:MAG: ABC transporter ATP-binding protein [Pirellulaceae bacterium]